MTRIHDRGTVLRVTILDESPVVVGEAPTRPAGFLRWYTREARGRGAPNVRIGGEDHRHAARLLERYGEARLKLLTVHFLRRHADVLLTGEYTHHMRLLSAKVGEVEQELAR